MSWGHTVNTRPLFIIQRFRLLHLNSKPKAEPIFSGLDFVDSPLGQFVPFRQPVEAFPCMERDREIIGRWTFLPLLQLVLIVIKVAIILVELEKLRWGWKRDNGKRELHEGEVMWRIYGWLMYEKQAVVFANICSNIQASFTQCFQNSLWNSSPVQTITDGKRSPCKLTTDTRQTRSWREWTRHAYAHVRNNCD